MSRLSSVFSSLVRATAADEYEDWCVHCRRNTIWKLAMRLAGQSFYKCQRCGCERVTP